MSRLLQGDEWTIRRWTRAPIHVDDDDLWKQTARVPLHEELGLVAALIVLASVALLLV